MAKTRFQLDEEEKAAAKVSDKKRDKKGAIKSVRNKKPKKGSAVKFHIAGEDLQGAGAVAEEELKASTEVSGASAGDGYKHPYNDEAEHNEVLDEIARYKLDTSHVTT